jgi:hypothetical protein
MADFAPMRERQPSARRASLAALVVVRLAVAAWGRAELGQARNARLDHSDDRDERARGVHGCRLRSNGNALRRVRRMHAAAAAYRGLRTRPTTARRFGSGL